MATADRPPTGIERYSDPEMVRRYHETGGLDPERKARLHAAATGALGWLAGRGLRVLELGAGSGHFTRKLLDAGLCREVVVTDGSASMLDLAAAVTGTGAPRRLLDFNDAGWGEELGPFDAVVSVLALQYAFDKEEVFREAWQALVPGGWVVMGVHLVGGSGRLDRAVDEERAAVSLRLGGRPVNETGLQEAVAKELAHRGGKLRLSLGGYQAALGRAGFQDVDCLWRDWWMALLVGRRADGRAASEQSE